ncbi:MAG: SMI1/KNR4 family protein [Lachnospiraceae bacterium]|nr:SMI1/KNR4 family protein [Lachnospiraceae bacterium]
MFNLKSVEKKQNIILPSRYKNLYQFDFKEIEGRMNICTKEETIRISKFLNAEEMNNIIDEFYDFWSYDIIPIAETEYDNYICLFYRKNSSDPSVIYWDYDLAIECEEDAIFYLYDNIEELFLNLK